VIALVLWSGLPLRRIPGRLWPIGLAVLSLTAFSILLAGANSDPSLAEVVRIGPFRITGEAVWAGLAVGLRLVVIALTTLLVLAVRRHEPGRLLVQQAAPDRFAYGSLAALRVAPLWPWTGHDRSCSAAARMAPAPWRASETWAAAGAVAIRGRNAWPWLWTPALRPHLRAHPRCIRWRDWLTSAAVAVAGRFARR
jgi:hypothetical protein